jgi:hypothetical protein
MLFVFEANLIPFHMTSEPEAQNWKLISCLDTVISVLTDDTILFMSNPENFLFILFVIDFLIDIGTWPAAVK